MISIKLLNPGYKLYGAKNKNIGDKILDYTKQNEIKNNQKCLYENISWFGDLEQAQHYVTKETKIFTWQAKREINLAKTTQSNEKLFKNLFLTNTTLKLDTTIPINEQMIPEKYKSFINHFYLTMDNNQKAWFEFAFAFGYITVKEQYDFLLFIYYLIKYKILEINMRNGKSILNKLYTKIEYYYFNPLPKQKKYNRLSFYEIDKYALVNICLLFKNNKKYRPVNGIYQKDASSFWFPNFIIYKMNIQEYILFSPHECLELI